MRHAISVLVMLAMTTPWAHGRDAEDIVRDTPCLTELRAWLNAGRPSGEFEIPDGLTADQCDRAREVNASGWFAHELALTQQRQREEVANAESRRKFAQLEADIAKASRDSDEAFRRQMAQFKREREALAKRPAARLGMDQATVLSATNWGRPHRRSRVTTAAGVTETWFYDGRGALVFSSGKVASIHEY